MGFYWSYTLLLYPPVLMRSCFTHMYLSISSSLHISSQPFGGSQEAGLGWGLSRPIPPVSRKRHSSSSISWVYFSRFTHSTNENSNCVCVCAWKMGNRGYIDRNTHTPVGEKTDWRNKEGTKHLPYLSQRVIDRHCSRESRWNVLEVIPTVSQGRLTALRYQ